MAVAAALMVVARPLDVRDPGFILTFGATFGAARRCQMGGPRLIAACRVVSGHCMRPCSTEPRALALQWTLASLVASLSVEVVLLPVSAQAFSRVTLAGIVLNLLAVPLMAVVQMAGIALTLGAAMPAASRAVPAGLRMRVRLPWWRARAWSRRSPRSRNAFRRLGSPSCLSTTRTCGAAVGAVADFAGWAASPWPAPGSRSSWVRAPCGRSALPATPGLRLTVFDVGQAEAMLLQTAGAGALMIDAGGAPFGGGGYDVGFACSRRRSGRSGIRAVETLVITHGDPDHIGGAAALIDDFEPRDGSGPASRSHHTSRHGSCSRRAARAGVAARDAARRPRCARGVGRASRAAPARARLGAAARPQRRFRRDRGCSTATLHCS